ncbi:hypothetical protein ACIBK8_04345 [Streptomyces sp. NPDC050161]|uniref:hypothetical protein n=1 Tax=Streptomyces sp. NPDC050161 TaxID=3365604 RepID=UPI00378FF331
MSFQLNVALSLAALAFLAVLATGFVLVLHPDAAGGLPQGAEWLLPLAAAVAVRPGRGPATGGAPGAVRGAR